MNVTTSIGLAVVARRRASIHGKTRFGRWKADDRMRFDNHDWEIVPAYGDPSRQRLWRKSNVKCYAIVERITRSTVAGNFIHCRVNRARIMRIG